MQIHDESPTSRKTTPRLRRNPRKAWEHGPERRQVPQSRTQSLLGVVGNILSAVLAFHRLGNTEVSAPALTAQASSSPAPLTQLPPGAFTESRIRWCIFVQVLSSLINNHSRSSYSSETSWQIAAALASFTACPSSSMRWNSARISAGTNTHGKTDGAQVLLSDCRDYSPASDAVAGFSGSYALMASNGRSGVPLTAYWSISRRIFHSSKRALVSTGIHGCEFMVTYMGAALTSWLGGCCQSFLPGMQRERGRGRGRERGAA